MEEDYTNTVRGMYISGIFDNFDGDETAELPNCADVLGMDIEIDGKRFSLCEGEMISYSRYLDIRNAELVRKCVWKPLGKGRVTLEFRRIVSKKRLHSLAQTVKIMPEDTGMDVRIITGINGRMTNSGVQHFSETEKRVRDGKILQYMQRTLQSHVTVIYNMGFRYFVTEGEKMCCLYPKTEIRTLRRKIELSAEVRLKKGQTFLLEKIVDVRTSRDKKSVGESISEIAQKSMEAVQENLRLGYNRLRDEHVSAWEANLWNRCIGKIFGGSEEEKRAFDYALYQLYAMVPAHDDRMRLAEKGLSGEGDKGHVFWDTEIFALPCYIFTCPEIARNLLLYRYRCLEVAKKKAAEYGYRGAQYPWESAWFTDGEETPKLGDPELNTGKRDKVWTGLIEHHISADVAYGVWLYYTSTDDWRFMEKYGCEMLFETAEFWQSVLVPGEDGLLHIYDVIGPDEYKIHVDDNAFTNYMAAWNIKTAEEFAGLLKEKSPEIYVTLSEKTQLESRRKKWKNALKSMYLPFPEENTGIIPQDAAYLKLKEIDVGRYKWKTASILKEYSPSDLNEIQVSKQADVLVLFSLLKNRFSEEILAKNWEYYEARTLHDSSLLPSVYCVTACRCRKTEEAYKMFRHAIDTDLGNNMHSSDEGLHMASLAGIWQCIVMGFGGVGITDRGLYIEPVLPEAWNSLNSLEFSICWQNETLQITVTKEDFDVKNLTGKKVITYYHKGEKREC